jgi:hypothetical protein
MEPFVARYPALQLEDELPLDGGGDVMWGRTYTRRHRARDVRQAAERAARTEESRDQFNGERMTRAEESRDQSSGERKESRREGHDQIGG